MRIINRCTAEKRWFAWYPVRCYDGRWAWCQYVAYCRKIVGGFGHVFHYRLYRKVTATEPLSPATDLG